MKKLFYAAFIYLAAGLAAGLYYRELTTYADFPPDGRSQLGLVHGHLIVLGFLILMVVLVLDKVFSLSGRRMFSWFFWIYNAGVVVTAAALVWHGSLTVLGHESTPMIAGIAGLGHMLLGAGAVLLFLVVRPAVLASSE
jgi:hypothetical protein